MPQDVAMFDPSGTVRQIPADQVADAQKSGAQIAHSMIDPSGKARYIPHDQYDKALAAGALPKGAVGRKSDHEIGTLSTQKGTAPAKTATDKVANFIGKESPTIAGALGGVAGGAMGGLPGAVGGAVAGGEMGESLRAKTIGGEARPMKEGAIQGAYELGGGLVGKGIERTAKLLGIDEAIMKFALKSGEDVERGLNPAEAIKKAGVKDLVTKNLYQKVAGQVDVLSKRADAIMQQALPTSNTIKPYAVIKGVLDKYKTAAAKTADPEIKSAMEGMIESVEKEFAPKPTAHQVASSVLSGGKTGQVAQISKTMSIEEANALKKTWGESVDWAKKPADDKLQAVYKAEQEARRDIYQSLNQSIKDAMGPDGKAWHSVNHDIFNLVEAKSLLKQSMQHQTQANHGLAMNLVDAMRRPGLASVVGDVARNVPQNLAQPGVIPNIGRATMFGADAVSGNSPIPMQQGK